MPYVNEKARKRYGEALDAVCARIGNASDFQNPGELTYILFRACKAFLPEFPRYIDLNAVIGCLECCKLELYRRLVVPHEKGAMERNGDVE